MRTFICPAALLGAMVPFALLVSAPGAIAGPLVTFSGAGFVSKGSSDTPSRDVGDPSTFSLLFDPRTSAFDLSVDYSVAPGELLHIDSESDFGYGFELSLDVKTILTGTRHISVSIMKTIYDSPDASIHDALIKEFNLWISEGPPGSLAGEFDFALFATYNADGGRFVASLTSISISPSFGAALALLGPARSVPVSSTIWLLIPGLIGIARIRRAHECESAEDVPTVGTSTWVGRDSVRY